MFVPLDGISSSPRLCHKTLKRQIQNTKANHWIAQTLLCSNVYCSAISAVKGFQIMRM